MELKLAFHALTGRRIVEVYDNGGAFVAGIYPDEENNGVKIVSKSINKSWLDRRESAVYVKFWRL